MTVAEQVISVFCGVRGYLDDIELTLRNKDQIKNYENQMKLSKPWLFNNE